MTLQPTAEATAAPLPVDSHAQPAQSRRKDRKLSRAALEALEKAPRWPSRSPAARRLKAIKRGWLQRLGNVDALMEAAVEAAARTALLLELADTFSLMELRSPVNKGKRALHGVVLQRQQLADQLFRQLSVLGLTDASKTEGRNDFLANLAIEAAMDVNAQALGYAGFEERRVAAQENVVRLQHELNDPAGKQAEQDRLADEVRMAREGAPAPNVPVPAPRPDTEVIPAGEQIPPTRTVHPALPAPECVSHSTSRLLTGMIDDPRYDVHEEWRELGTRGG